MIFLIKILILGISIFGIYLIFLVIKDKVEIERIDKILNRKEGEEWVNLNWLGKISKKMKKNQLL